jgi:lipid-binding SYLF domain-containing protein
MKHIKLIIGLLLSTLIFSGFWSGDGKNENHKERVERIKTKNETLKLLYKYAPEARGMVARSYGYAVFANYGVNVILLSAEGGKGLAHNNRTNRNTYMNMASAGVGIGLGVKDFRTVFLFRDAKAYNNFTKYGWEANAQADAAAKAGREGIAINAAITVAPGVRLYKLTQNGLAFQATIQGTKYWQDEDLN